MTAHPFLVVRNDAALAQGLVFAFCGDEMTIHAADVFKFDVFGALGRACAGVGAVSESEFVHLVDHGFCAAIFLHFAPGRRASWLILADTKSMAEPFLQATTHTSAPDAACRVHGFVSLHL